MATFGIDLLTQQEHIFTFDIGTTSGGTSSSGITAANNGLTRSGNTVRLGGTLASNTTINLNTNTLNLTGGNLKLGGNFTGNTICANTQFIGAGTGLSGYAANLSVLSATTASNSLSLGGSLANTYAKLASPTFTGTVKGANANMSGNITGNTVLLKRNPTIGSFEAGKMFYDEVNKTASVMINTGITLQLGQEELMLVYNNTGSDIANGKLVYLNSSNGDMPVVALAIANDETKSHVVGMSTEIIKNNSSGFITVRGIVHEINTSGYTAGVDLYLSATSAGEFTDVEPMSPTDYSVKIGTPLLISSTDGSVYIKLCGNNKITDLSDVTVSNPSVDQVLRYNGTFWVNGAPINVNSGVGLPIFLDDTMIISGGTGPQTIPLYTLSRTPSLVSEVIVPASVNNTTALIKRFLFNTELGGTKIDAGIWTFNTYNYVDNVNGTSSMPTTVRRVIAGTGTVTITGAGTSRTATVTGAAPFVAGDVNADIKLSGLLRTPKAIFRIIGFTSTSVVTIETLSTYTNETGVTYHNHKFLFTDSTQEINHTSVQLYVTQSVQPEFAINPTDKLEISYYGTTTSSRTLYLYHNGNNNYSNFLTPLVIRHNDLPGLQGGTGTERYHMTQAESVVLSNTSGINTGNQDLSPYVPFTGAISSVNLGSNSLTGSTICATTCFLGKGLGIGWTNLTTGAVVVGADTIASGTSLSNSAVLGVKALKSATTASGNVAIGYNAMSATTTGGNSVAIGLGALSKNTTGGNHVAIGCLALSCTNNSSYNVAIGATSLNRASTGSYNVAIGLSAVGQTTSGRDNIGIGQLAIYSNSTGCNNVGIGHCSFRCNTVGSCNTAIGMMAGTTVLTGASTTFIGANSGNHLLQATNIINSTAIGANTYTSKSNQVVIGSSGVTETIINGDIVYAKSLVIGTPTSNVIIDSVRGIILSGSTTTFEDLRFPATAINPAGAANPMTFDPDLVGFIAGATGTQTIAIIGQMPHQYKIGSAISPHIHWMATTTNVGNVLWRLEYKWTNINATESGSWTTIDATGTTTGVANVHQIAEFPDIDGTGKGISSMLIMRISRIGGDAIDTFTGNALLREFDIHYEIDSFGSKDEYIK